MVVDINGSVVTVPVLLLTATPNLATDVIVGAAPANSALKVTLDQCVYSYGGPGCAQRVTSDAAGIFTAGPFTYSVPIGSGYETRTFDIVPGNTGQVEYTNPDGNVVFISYAAAQARVQVGGRQVDGWVSVGGYSVTVTLKDGVGAVKAAQTVWPDEQGVLGLHYVANLGSTIAAGDTVEVAAGDTATAIVVDALTAHLNFDADRITGVGPANQSFVATIRGYTVAVNADVAGSFTITNPFLDRNGVAAVLDLQPGDYGALSHTHADGNQVYASLGQSVFVQQNGNLVYGYAGYPTDPGVPLSITVYAPGGSVKGACSTPGTYASRYGDFWVLLSATRLDCIPTQYWEPGWDVPIIIRAGDTMVVDINGSVVTVPVPLLTATPNLATDVVVGAAPANSALKVTLEECLQLNGGSTSGCAQRVTSDAAGIYAAGPFTYTVWTDSGPEPRTFDIVPSNTGQVEYTNPDGNVVFIAYAATGVATTIAAGGLRAGATAVLGTAVPGATVEIWDATDSRLIGMGAAGANATFAVNISPPLVYAHTIVAIANGLPSVPHVVGRVVTIQGPATSVTNTVGFYGIAPANSLVEVWDNSTRVVTTTATAAGHWNALAVLANGTHTLAAHAPAIGQESDPLTVTVDPTAVSIGGSSGTVGGQSHASNPSGENHFQVTGGVQPITVTVDVLNNPCTVTLSFMGQTITPTAGIVPSGQISFTAVFDDYDWSFGTHEVRVTAESCGGTSVSGPVAEVTLIDPSGYVYDAVTGERIVGAEVTCYYSDTVKGQWVVWEAGLYNNQLNPQSTDEEGRYGFMVPAGDYYVVAGKPGYAGNQTVVYTILLPVTDANIPLTLMPLTVTIRESEDAVEIAWDHLGEAVDHYEVWRSAAPYFTPDPDDPESEMHKVFPPDVGNQVSYPDSDTAGMRYFYVVLPMSASSMPYPASNRVGMFSFALAPGTP